MYVDIFGEVHLSDSSHRQDSLDLETPNISPAEDVPFTEVSLEDESAASESGVPLEEAPSDLVFEKDLLADVDSVEEPNQNLQQVEIVEDLSLKPEFEREQTQELLSVEVPPSAQVDLPVIETSNADNKSLRLESGGAQMMPLEQALALLPAKKFSHFEQEIENFANSQNDTGPISYSLIIGDLQNKEVIDNFRLALEDPRLGLNTVETLSQITDGKLVIPNLNPAQIVVLVHKLLKIPVKLAWEQTLYEN